MIRRQRRDAFDQLVIEEWDPILDRVRHRHPVLAHQQIDQIGPEVVVQDVAPVVPRAVAEDLPPVVRDGLQRRIGTKLSQGFEPEERGAADESSDVVVGAVTGAAQIAEAMAKPWRRPANGSSHLSCRRIRA